MITVLTATRNRAELLERALNSYTHLTCPPGSWEAIAVDNGSAEGTADVVRRLAGTLPVTYVAEPQPGKSLAVNAWLQHVRGDLIVFTDDDILPVSDWFVRRGRRFPARSRPVWRTWTLAQRVAGLRLQDQGCSF